MPKGPGAYDDEISGLMKSTGAHAIILIVFGGNKGSGMSVQSEESIAADIPAILRKVAEQVEGASE